MLAPPPEDDGSTSAERAAALLRAALDYTQVRRQAAPEVWLGVALWLFLSHHAPALLNGWADLGLPTDVFRTLVDTIREVGPPHATTTSAGARRP